MEEQQTLHIFANVMVTRAGKRKLMDCRLESQLLENEFDDVIESIEAQSDKREEQARMLYDHVKQIYPKRYKEEQVRYLFEKVFATRQLRRDNAYMQQCYQEY